MEKNNLKNENQAILIPKFWRPTLCKIIESIINNDFCTISKLNEVESLSKEGFKQMIYAIEDYGKKVISLSEETWVTSVCSWQLEYWSLLVDLHTEDGESDLVLSVRVIEKNKDYVFQLFGIYVP